MHMKTNTIYRRKKTWENLLTAQMSGHKTVLLIRMDQPLLFEMSVDLPENLQWLRTPKL